jgi:perosamine synthetase
MTDKFIPVYSPSLLGNESKYVNECLETGWISSKGTFVGRFENSFNQYLGSSVSSTSVCNGTVALHLALLALGIGRGDEVIVPTLTYIASVNAIAYVGATPVFVDSVSDTWNMDIDQIESKINERTKAILAVHLYGAPCEMSRLVEICQIYGLKLIEDVAEALGSQIDGKFAGTFGDVGTFSFFGNKTITTGEGGMIVSSQHDLIERISFLKSQAVSLNKQYWHDEIGYNYRMTNICAAIGLAQMERIQPILESKRRIASWYESDLEDLPIVFQCEKPGSIHSHWMVSILFESKGIRDGIRESLRISEIETRPLFFPAHVMPAFKTNERYPISEELSKRGINLPSFPSLTRDQVSKISHVIRLKLNEIT